MFFLISAGFEPASPYDDTIMSEVNPRINEFDTRGRAGHCYDVARLFDAEAESSRKEEIKKESQE